MATLARDKMVAVRKQEGVLATIKITYCGV